jgi:hypothetical protein
LLSNKRALALGWQPKWTAILDQAEQWLKPKESWLSRPPTGGKNPQFQE